MSISGIVNNGYAQYRSSAPADPVNQAFQQLGNDLKSGNLSAAQSDYSVLRQEFQTHSGPVNRYAHGPHRLSVLGNMADMASLLAQLGQDLATGNLAAAQKLYTTFQPHGPMSTGGSLNPTSPPTMAPPVSLIA